MVASGRATAATELQLERLPTRQGRRTMVTEAFVAMLFSLFSAVATWMAAHLPSPPSFWSDMTTALNNVTSATSTTVLYFLPVGPAVTAGVAITALVVALGFIRLVRRAVSLFTGGGGS